MSGRITTSSSHADKGEFIFKTSNITEGNTLDEAEDNQSFNSSVYHSFANDYNQMQSYGIGKDAEANSRYTMSNNSDVSRESILDNHKNGNSFYKNHVNVSVWINHLRLNYILKIFIIISLALTTILFTWITKEFGVNSKVSLNISPAFISVDGKWLFMSFSYDCRPIDFCEGYCGNYSTSIFISSCVHCFGVLVCCFIYIASLIVPQRNVDKFNWLALLATLFAWTMVILINNDFSNLSTGFYSMILIVIVSLLIQIHYTISRKKMRSKILINQLLEA